MEGKKFWFFGSKLNTILLLILIILMVFAIRIMKQNKEMYLGVWQKPTEQVNDDWKKYPIDTVPADVHNEDFKTNPSILGNKEDLNYFSIWPGTKLPQQIISFRGSISNGYFFEANIIINVLDSKKKLLKASNAMTKSDWMTSGPVDFEGYIDLTGLPKGLAYVEIHNDNASGLPEYDKSILIPIVIE